MGKEIERKFIVKNDLYVAMATARKHIRQAYLNTDPDATVRVRVTDDSAWLTVKGRNSGAVRDEWEYPVPVNDAVEMAEKLCGGFAVDKIRYIVPFEGWTWEVDRFNGSHEGLVVAEIEMPSADCDPPLPPFVGEEVTGDPRYYNSTLSKKR